MGVPKSEMRWEISTTHQGESSGKQPDRQLTTRPHLPRDCPLRGWPTLVIESGMTESLERLVRQDARWWFRNSHSDVKYVLIISIHTGENRVVQLEKWGSPETHLT